MTFDGKVALVTGAGSGMGAATARLLAKRGASVALVGIVDDDLATVRGEIEAAGGKAVHVLADVSRPDDLDKAVKITQQTYGGLHLAANCAGVACDLLFTGEISPADWLKTTRVNLDGVFHSLRYEIPAILASGGGSIVNVSSVFAHRGFSGRSPYAASKHGVWGLTKSAALEYAAQGVRINGLAPGVIDTPMLGTDRATSAAVAQTIAVRRIGRPEEIATAIAFLLSDEASYVVGAELMVDGGFLA